MSKSIRLIVSVTLLAATVIACTAVEAAPSSEDQVATKPAAEPRTITVIGQGKVSLKPDIATINVGTTARSNTVSEAKAKVDTQMAAISAVLEEAGVDEKDIQTSHYGIHKEREPIQEIRSGPVAEIEGGYSVTSMVRVTVRDVEKAGSVLDAVIQAGANQVHGVSFTVSDERAWQSQARANAMADAQSRAQELADLADLELGEVLSVSEVIGGIPVPLMGIKSPAGSGGMAPGELELSTQIQVTFVVR
jgi:uncharacterized protein YggE